MLSAHSLREIILVVLLLLIERENNVAREGGIEATDIGFEIIQSMRKYIPNIVSTDLTRSMEEQLEGIESGKIEKCVCNRICNK